MGKHLYTHFVQFSSVRTLPEAEKQQHVGAVVTQPTGSLKHRGVARIRALVGYRHNCNLQLTVPAVQGDTVVRTFPGAERQGRVVQDRRTACQHTLCPGSRLQLSTWFTQCKAVVLLPKPTRPYSNVHTHGVLHFFDHYVRMLTLMKYTRFTSCNVRSERVAKQFVFLFSLLNY